LLKRLEDGYVTAVNVRGRCLDLDLTIGNLHLAVFSDYAAPKENRAAETISRNRVSGLAEKPLNKAAVSC
jgi:hypothetical protein